jgi:hypothetical protein
MYQRSGSGWSQIAKLIAPDGEAGDWFGGNVSLCGDNALLGATSFGAQGAAYAYQRVGTDWILSDKLLALDGATGDQFGNFVALSNEYAIVGADASGDFGASSGSAYIFQVPEPATLSLLVLGLGAVFIRKGAKR